MNKLNIILIFAMLLCITSCGQVKNTSGVNHNLINKNLLIGKWRSANDSQFIITFEKGKYIELYGKDTTDNMHYKLSASCNLYENSTKITLHNAFLLFYSNNDSLRQCNEILNFNGRILSWINNSNGKIFVFEK